MIRIRNICLLLTATLAVAAASLGTSTPTASADEPNPWACVHVAVLDGAGACIYNPIEL